METSCIDNVFPASIGIDIRDDTDTNPESLCSSLSLSSDEYSENRAFSELVSKKSSSLTSIDSEELSGVDERKNSSALKGDSSPKGDIECEQLEPSEESKKDRAGELEDDELSKKESSRLEVLDVTKRERNIRDQRGIQCANDRRDFCGKQYLRGRSCCSVVHAGRYSVGLRVIRQDSTRYAASETEKANISKAYWNQFVSLIYRSDRRGEEVLIHIKVNHFCEKPQKFIRYCFCKLGSVLS